MKHFIFFLLSIVLSTSVFSQNENEVNKAYSNYGEIPNWVKEKVTREEYKMLKTINTIFNIDYSFLEQELTPTQKERLYQRIQEMYTDIRSGKYTNKERTNLTFVPLDNYGDPDYKWKAVPDSIKKIVNEEEYEALQTIAGLYKVDYSFVDEITFLPPEKRKDLTEHLQNIALKVQNGELENARGNTFSILLPAQVDTTINWKYEVLYQIDNNLQFCKRKAIVYTSQHNNKAKVYLEVWYVYDSAKKKANILNHKMSSSMPLSEFHGSAALSHWEKENLLQGEFSGTYEYYDEYKQKHWEDVRKGFHIPLEQ